MDRRAVLRVRGPTRQPRRARCADAVFVSRSTYEAVKEVVEAKNMGLFEVRGKSEPVPIYRIVGRRDL